ncbi:MAG TPA: hypothetical protein PK571_07985, partial [Methylotenera sp.]|nr:hypothetical protein [Methylotenera sp.]
MQPHLNNPNLNNIDTQTEKDWLGTLRLSLQTGLARIKNEFQQKPNIAKLFNQHCELIDRLLVELWSKSQANTSCCLIAVGGYGRGELYPYSDIAQRAFYAAGTTAAGHATD